MPNNAKRKTASALKYLQPGLIVVSAVLLLVWITGGIARQPQAQLRMTVNGHSFWLERAQTPQQLAKGLGGRTSLAADHGMLFIFEDEAARCFWMKDTHIPLDIVWMGSDKIVRYVQPNVQPNSYPHTFCADNFPARYVVELPAGTAQTRAIQPGTPLHW